MEKKIILGVLTLMPIILLLCASSGLVAYAEEPTPPLPEALLYININPEEVVQMLEEAEAMQEEVPAHIILLDVRAEEEYFNEHIPGAVNIPLSELESRLEELDERETYIVYCKSGDRSRTASETLVQHGFRSVYNMVGGINAWKEKFATSIATPTPTQTPSPVASPAFTPAASPSPITSPILTPTPEEEKRVPGFEASFAIQVLLILFMLLRRKRR